MHPSNEQKDSNKKKVDFSRIKQLPKPANFKLNAVGRGEIKLGCATYPDIWAYQFEYKQMIDLNIQENPKWICERVFGSKIILTGLKSGHEYVCRVSLVGFLETRNYSDEIRCVVL